MAVARSRGPFWDHTSCAMVNDLRVCACLARAPNRLHTRGDQRKTCYCDLLGSSGLVAASEQRWVHRNTVTRKSVVVYSTPMTRNGPVLPGSGRSRWKTNHLVTQQKIRNNRTYPDLWVVNPLVASSSLAHPNMETRTRSPISRCMRPSVDLTPCRGIAALA